MAPPWRRVAVTGFFYLFKITFTMQHVKEQTGNSLPMEFRFNSAERPIRVELFHEIPWFIVKDVCAALCIANYRDAISKLDDDEKLVSEIPTSGQRRKMLFVNESGIYSLIFRSNKPEARMFRKWVTNEVLPQIRKNGHYSPSGSPSGEGAAQPEINDVILRACDIAGSQRQLARFLDVSESVLCDIRNRPWKISTGLTRRVEAGCRDIVRLGEVPQNALRSLNSKDLGRMWFDIAMIESYEVRKRISLRMKRILAREDDSSGIPALREKGGRHAV